MTDVESTRPAATYSLLGFVIGTIAFVVVVVQFVAGPFAPQPEVSQTLGQMAGEMARSAVGSFFGREPDNETAMVAREWDIDRIMVVGAMVLGAVAIFLGGLGLIRHEQKRAVMAALGVGSLTIAFQFVASTILMILGVILILGVMAMAREIIGDLNPLE